MIPTATSAATASATASSATSALITTETALTTAGVSGLAVQEFAVTTALVSILGSQIANKLSQLQQSNSAIIAETSDAKLQSLVKQIQNYLGKEARAFRNEAGDLVIESHDGLIQYRVDLARTYPHLNPHMHIMRFRYEKNKKLKILNLRIYPKDVKPE